MCRRKEEKTVINVKARKRLDKKKKRSSRYCFPKCYRLHFVQSCNNSVVPAFGTTDQSGTLDCMLITINFSYLVTLTWSATITNIIIYYH